MLLLFIQRSIFQVVEMPIRRPLFVPAHTDPLFAVTSRQVIDHVL